MAALEEKDPKDLVCLVETHRWVTGYTGNFEEKMKAWDQGIPYAAVHVEVVDGFGNVLLQERGGYPEHNKFDYGATTVVTKEDLLKFNKERYSSAEMRAAARAIRDELGLGEEYREELEYIGTAQPKIRTDRGKHFRPWVHVYRLKIASEREIKPNKEKIRGTSWLNEEDLSASLREYPGSFAQWFCSSFVLLHPEYACQGQQASA